MPIYEAFPKPAFLTCFLSFHFSSLLLITTSNVMRYSTSSTVDCTKYLQLPSDGPFLFYMSLRIPAFFSRSQFLMHTSAHRWSIFTVLVSLLWSIFAPGFSFFLRHPTVILITHIDLEVSVCYYYRILMELLTKMSLTSSL